MTLTRELTVPTPDGTCPVTLHYPNTGSPFPPVILYMDGPGIRPAVHEIAARLAASGYAVFLPDLFYRAGPYAPVDTKVLIAAIDAVPEAADGPIGVVGYCMGGRLALIAAATFPDRIAAIASYHGGGLANDKPGSPHLLAPQIKAKVYVGGAIEDANFTEDQKVTLTATLAEAGVDHVVETYPAKHGWVPRDTAVHDPAEAEHHWQTLVPFLDGALKQA